MLVSSTDYQNLLERLTQDSALSVLRKLQILREMCDSDNTSKSAVLNLIDSLIQREAK